MKCYLISFNLENNANLAISRFAPGFSVAQNTFRAKDNRLYNSKRLFRTTTHQRIYVFLRFEVMQFSYWLKSALTLHQHINLATFAPYLYRGGGGKFAPLSKNCLVSDRSKIFCLLRLFFVKF